MEPTTLSNMQKELLKLYATDIPEQQLQEIKTLLSEYFANKATEGFDQIWEEKKWDEQTMNEWANEHNRSKNSH
jgi:hypothetical protein